MTADITLINPCTYTRRMPPLGILYIASYLELQGITVKVIDDYPETTIKDPKKYETDSDYVGISCMSSQWKKAREVTRIVKEYNPNAIVVAGGVHPTVATEEVSKENSIDIIVVGVGEKAMLKIITQKITSGIVQGEMFDNLDDRPLPARNLVDMKKYTARDSIVQFHWLKGTSVITSLGCPNNCIYCINSKRAMFGREVKYNSANYVEKEISQLVSDYNIEGMYFQDDNFSGWKKRAIEICKKIKRFDLTWMCESRVNTLDSELLQHLKESGCDGIGFGVESGSPKVLNILNKKAEIDQVIKAFDLCHKYKMKTLAQMIIGSPEETFEDIALSEKLLDRIKPDYVQVSHLTPYQGTALYDMALEKGWLRENTSMTMNKPQMVINFSFEELEEIEKRLQQKYNPTLKSLRPYMNLSFVYDMIRIFFKQPFLITKGKQEWMDASRIYL